MLFVCFKCKRKKSSVTGGQMSPKSENVLFRAFAESLSQKRFIARKLIKAIKVFCMNSHKLKLKCFLYSEYGAKYI